jgi:hypothetical protein
VRAHGGGSKKAQPEQVDLTKEVLVKNLTSGVQIEVITITALNESITGRKSLRSWTESAFRRKLNNRWSVQRWSDAIAELS